MPSMNKRLCKQCGGPLPAGARYNAILCENCKIENERLRQKEKNRKWYLRNKSKITAKRRSVKENQTNKSDGIRIPSPEEVRKNVDMLLKRAMTRPVKRGCHRPAAEDSTERSFSTRMVDGREYVVETRGPQIIGTYCSNTKYSD